MTCSSEGRWSCPGSWEEDTGPEQPCRATGAGAALDVYARPVLPAHRAARTIRGTRRSEPQAPVPVLRRCWSRGWTGGTEPHPRSGGSSEEHEHESGGSAGPRHRLLVGHWDCGHTVVWHQLPGQGEVPEVQCLMLLPKSSETFSGPLIMDFQGCSSMQWDFSSYFTSSGWQQRSCSVALEEPVVYPTSQFPR